MRTPTIQPAATKEERLRQYVAALLEYDGETFLNRTLGFRGAIWNYPPSVLRKAGIIEATRTYRPVQYRWLVPKTCLEEWMRSEGEKR